MTIQFPARKKSVRHASPPPLELRDVRATPNGAHPQVTLVLSRPLTEYEARVVWEFFPLASASEGSTKITVHLMRRPPPVLSSIRTYGESHSVQLHSNGNTRGFLSGTEPPSRRSALPPAVRSNHPRHSLAVVVLAR